MTKIARNAPCSCGSGKKYKHCCLKKKTRLDTVPWSTFPENFVLSELLKSSQEFSAFYQAERGKITKELHWAQDLSMPPGIDYRSTRKGDVQIVRLRRVPAIVEDAQMIAHELLHFVLDTEGFPCVGSKPELENKASALGSMLLDPIVDSRLQIYGFDLWSSYQSEVENDFRQLKQQPNPPSDRFEKLHWIFNYVDKVLYWEIAHGEESNSDNEFTAWFDVRYPEIAREGQELLILIKNIGYETPEKMAELYRKIISKYQLGKSFHVKTFP